MYDIERRRLVLSGNTPAEVNAAMRAYVGAHYEALVHGRNAPKEQYGRTWRYFQQLQALDVEGAWAKVTAPTLIVWGEYDWIMGREESDRAAAILGARATYIVRPGMNHHFDVYPDARAAFAEKGGRFDAGAADEIVAWLRARAR
jgi:pimeloyl-ACP methyl ester carboxylesterase